MNINKKITEVYKSELGSIYFVELENDTGIPEKDIPEILYIYEDKANYPYIAVSSNNAKDGLFTLAGFVMRNIIMADHVDAPRFAKFGNKVWSISPGKKPKRSTLKAMEEKLHPDVNGVLADMASYEARMVFDEDGSAYIIRKDFKLFHIACSDLKDVITPLNILDETGKVNRYLTDSEVKSLPENSYQYIYDIQQALVAK